MNSLTLEEDSSNRTRRNTTENFDPLFDRATCIQLNLSEYHYTNVVTHVREKLKFNIIVMGSPRVGKSQLINALCNGQPLAKTSSSLDSCTKEVTCYVLEDNQQRHPNVRPFKISFYDTPGIESWTGDGGKIKMIEFIQTTDPVCMIYCASPGSYASLPQLRSILEYCKEKGIFCALVCTNMCSGNQRDNVIDEFEKQLNDFGNKTIRYFDQICPPPIPHQVTFYGKSALCTMVNSIEYVDKVLLGNLVIPPRGIDELIQGIMEALNHEKLIGWCYAVLERRSYWEKILQNVDGFVHERWKELHRLNFVPLDFASHLINYLHDIISQK
jgi:hypothetical protein